MRAELKVDLKLPGRNAIPTCETLSRVQVSQGPDGKGGCWEGLKGREETKRGKKDASRKLVREEEGSKREGISGPMEGT